MKSPYKVVVWGPGEVGGAVLRACLLRPDIEIVGVRVFSAKREGMTVGELLGGEPSGVRATRSTAELLGIDADCVIVTPAASSMWRGDLDDDVIALLESGKNVIATVAYHNAARANWTSPGRASAKRLAEACERGGASLLGTGIHPSFMAERLAMTMSQAVTGPSHIRVVEALDFSTAPEGMWGGLDSIGFGSDLDTSDEDLFINKIGDLYYADIASNIGLQLLGAGLEEVRIERELVRIPAVADIEAGGVKIAAGTTAVLHLQHRGYVGDHNYFTNEEIWYVGADNAFRGDGLPFGSWKQGLLCYTIEVTGQAANLRTQLEFEIKELLNPVTGASVRAVLDALPVIVDAEPGVLVDDVGVHLRRDPRIYAASVVE